MLNQTHSIILFSVKEFFFYFCKDQLKSDSWEWTEQLQEQQSGDGVEQMKRVVIRLSNFCSWL